QLGKGATQFLRDLEPVLSAERFGDHTRAPRRPLGAAYRGRLEFCDVPDRVIQCSRPLLDPRRGSDPELTVESIGEESLRARTQRRRQVHGGVVPSAVGVITSTAPSTCTPVSQTKSLSARKP